MLISGEVHTNEIPLGHIERPDFVELVVNQNIRPDRPDQDEAPQLTDDSWQLAELCWGKDPLSRPNIGTVCDTISRSLGKTLGQRTLKVSDALFLEGVPGSSPHTLHSSLSLDSHPNHLSSSNILRHHT